MLRGVLAALVGVAAIFMSGGAARASQLFIFGIDFANATCGGGQACVNDAKLDLFTFPPTTLSVNYDLYYHTTGVATAPAVAYAGPNDADGIARVDLSPLRAKYIEIFSFDLVPIVAGQFDVVVNGTPYVVGPTGITVPGFVTRGSLATIEWTNANFVGITHINGLVPEPSTWALLILGFGLAGAALRRRPRLRANA